jgi:hypothetical protein
MGEHGRPRSCWPAIADVALTCSSSMTVLPSSVRPGL